MEYFAGTIVGLRTEEGAVLASDTRAVGYYLVLSKRARKLFRLEERIGGAFSGSPGDIQSLVSLLQAEANLYRMEHGRSISTRGLAQVAYGVLERNYRKGLSLEEGKRLAAEAIRTAIERDVATGDKVVVSVVDRAGYRELRDEEVDALLTRP